MKTSTKQLLQKLIDKHPCLGICEMQIEDMFTRLYECFKMGGKLLICGNGGSAADADHIVGELMKGFLLSRSLPEETAAMFGDMAPKLQMALPAISLLGHNALSSAYANDVAPDMIFAQQVFGYGREGDVLLAISTSGNAANVINAACVAKAMKLGVIGLTGRDGGKLRELCDSAVVAPEHETYLIQELHLPIYHAVCAMLENEFFS